MASKLELTQQASDNFQRANGALGGSNGWTAVTAAGGVAGGNSIVSNQVLGSTGSLCDFRSGESYSSDQYSTITFGTPVAGAGIAVGAIVRSTQAQQYLAIYDGDTPYVAIFSRTASGSFTLLDFNNQVANVPAGVAGTTTLMLSAEGSQITAWLNGVGVATVIDTAITGGAPGISTAGNVGISAWAGGNCMTDALPTATASDAFTRANGNMSSGQATWTTLAGVTFTGLTSVDPIIASNQLDTTGTTTHNAAIRNDISSADHYSSIVMGTVPVVGLGAGFIGTLVRSNGSNSAYLGCMFGGSAAGVANGYSLSGSPTYRIYRIDAGVSTPIAGCIANQDPAGTVYTTVAQGSRISFRANGREVLQVTDTTYASGVPGVMLFPPATADNYSAGVVTSGQLTGNYFINGFDRDVQTFALAKTYSGGSVRYNGFFRLADGSLALSTNAQSNLVNGFWRDSQGSLIVSTNAVASVYNGVARDSAGNVVVVSVASATAPLSIYNGWLHDAAGRLVTQ